MKYERDLYLIQQIFATIFTLSNKLQVTGDEAMNPLTTRQLMAMIAILHLPDEKSNHSNIAKMLGTTRQSIKQLITSLEKKGYLSCEPSSYDKRASSIKITDSGKLIVLDSTEKSTILLTKMFSKFTVEELEEFFRLLRKLYCFDKEERLNFEENVDFGVGDVLTDSQQKALELFEISRHNIAKEGIKDDTK